MDYIVHFCNLLSITIIPFQMSGFTVIINKDKSIVSALGLSREDKYGHTNRYQKKRITGKGFAIEQKNHQKFRLDHILNEDDNYIICINGVILNRTELMRHHNQSDIFLTLRLMYEKYGKIFVQQLKGDFSGFIYSKKENEWHIFTNHASSKNVFYFSDNKIFIFGSELRDISFLLEKFSCRKAIDLNGAYLLLTYGFVLEDTTLIESVKRIRPGNILSYSNHSFSFTEYFHLKNVQKTNDSFQNIIEKMDELFDRAIQLEFEKDKEYGYDHIVTLSGGLDSRMVALVAHQLGYEKQLNFTFSQSDYLDEQIAKQIASDYKHDFMFQSLDNGNYLKDIDKNVFYNNGLVVYSGSAHVMKNIENINFDKFGLIHTGMIGDAVVGSFLSKSHILPPQIESGAYSKQLLSKVAPYISEVIANYPSEELYKFYSRGFLGALNGYNYFDIFSQSSSPFLEVDFLTYCYSIPDELKYKQYIYLEWIKTKHPEFNNYVWEKTGVPPLKSNKLNKYYDYRYYKRMGMKFFDRISGNMQSGMNPFDYWLNKNTDLKNQIDLYFDNNISLVENNKELMNDCIQLFNNGNAGEKFQVLTLLGAIKLHEITL